MCVPLRSCYCHFYLPKRETDPLSGESLHENQKRSTTTTTMTIAVADPGFSKWGGAVLSQMGGAHILFSGKKCMKLKEIGLKWGGTRLLAPCYSKITIFL